MSGGSESSLNENIPAVKSSNGNTGTNTSKTEVQFMTNNGVL